MKFEFNTLIGILGVIASFLWGGFPMALQILLFFAIADYITGIAAAFHRKELSSRVGFNGIIKKIIMFLLCSVAFKIDLLLPNELNGALFNLVVFWYCGNEALSIMENAIELELKVPDKLKDAIEILIKEE